MKNYTLKGMMKAREDLDSHNFKFTMEYDKESDQIIMQTMMPQAIIEQGIAAMLYDLDLEDQDVDEFLGNIKYYISRWRMQQ